MEARHNSILLFGILFISVPVLIGTFYTVPPVPLMVFAQTSLDVDERRTELENELAELEKEIETQRQLVRDKQRTSVSLERDIGILDAQIEKAKLELRARNITIESLGSEISGKNATIDSLDAKIVREKSSLAALLRKTRELDTANLVLVAFANESLSEFFKDLDNFEAIQYGLQNSFSEIRGTRYKTENEKEDLVGKRSEERDLKVIQELERKRLEENEDEKEDLLAVTKGEEARYKDILAGQEKTAAEIRSELFQLRGTAAIPFGEALDYANAANAVTGVRPALILGVVAEESNLGENLGSGTWTEDMHPERDRPVFQKITEVLGLDPNQMPVSRAPWYGWGGAMGPAQFIPSTWACYGGFVNSSTGKCGRNPDRSWVGPWVYDANKDRIRELIGKASPSNPWVPQDAFMASAVLLKDNGADSGGYDAERLAALRYFAGWGNAEKPAYAFYGDDVMVLAEKYQSQIAILGR